MRWMKNIGAATSIDRREGQTTCLKGKLMQWQLDALTELFHTENLTDAKIRVSRAGHATFSANIPPSLHQRIRNILAG
jgi:hypothetical protein